jgi:hypothetical protein
MLNSSSKHIRNTNISSLQANNPLLRKDKKNDNHIATKQRLHSVKISKSNPADRTVHWYGKIDKTHVEKTH